MTKPTYFYRFFYLLLIFFFSISNAVYSNCVCLNFQFHLLSIISFLFFIPSSKFKFLLQYSFEVSIQVDMFRTHHSVIYSVSIIFLVCSSTHTVILHLLSYYLPYVKVTYTFSILSSPADFLFFYLLQLISKPSQSFKYS